MNGETSKGKATGPIANWIWKTKKEKSKIFTVFNLVNLEDVPVHHRETQFQGKIISSLFKNLIKV